MQQLMNDGAYSPRSLFFTPIQEKGKLSSRFNKSIRQICRNGQEPVEGFSDEIFVDEEAQGFLFAIVKLNLSLKND